jgi:hypothetical protein
MAEAGYTAAKPLKVKVQISASGSGQMQPLPMNEFVQQSLKQCGFDVQFDVIEWNTLFTNWRKGAKDPSANGANAINVSFAAMDPFFAMVRFTSTKAFPPVSNNWGYFGNAEFDKLIADARTSFDDKARDAALAKLHARIVEEAPFVWIAHDVGPRAMSPRSRAWCSRAAGSSTSPRCPWTDPGTTPERTMLRLPAAPHRLRPAHHARAWRWCASPWCTWRRVIRWCPSCRPMPRPICSARCAAVRLRPQLSRAVRHVGVAGAAGRSGHQRSPAAARSPPR